MMMEKISKTTRILLIYLVVTTILCSLSLYLAHADPQGSSISGTPTVDTGPNASAATRTDPGGRIITLVLDAEQQNNAWKAYVGNVTGTYVLKNSNNYSIYEWPAGTTVEGEVYIARNGSLTFGAVGCANNAEMVTEQATFGMGNTDTDNINNTFNSTNHSTFDVGATTIPQNNCSSVALWVNDTSQIPSPSAIFQEVVLRDGSANIIFTSVLNNNKIGFQNTSMFDFQAIVPENRSSGTGTAYYFYVELGD